MERRIELVGVGIGDFSCDCWEYLIMFLIMDCTSAICVNSIRGLGSGNACADY